MNIRKILTQTTFISVAMIVTAVAAQQQLPPPAETPTETPAETPAKTPSKTPAKPASTPSPVVHKAPVSVVRQSYPSNTGSDDSGFQTNRAQQKEYRVCFHTMPNFNGDSFCKFAPSRVVGIGQRLPSQIQSIKITKISGASPNSAEIRLKVCDKNWRRGTCEIFSKSQNTLDAAYPFVIKSYAFDVKS